MRIVVVLCVVLALCAPDGGFAYSAPYEDLKLKGK